MKYNMVKLKELCIVNQGLQIPISKRYREPGENRYFYITVQFLKESGENYYIETPPKNVTCTESEILVVRTGNTGQVITGVAGCFHNNFFKVTPNEKIYPKYLYYALNNKKMHDAMLNAASGTTIPDLKHSSFYNLEIPLPNIKVQKKIAKILDNICNKLRLNNEINNNLQELINSIFKRWFVDFEFPNGEGKSYKSSNGKMIDSELGEIPEEWKVIIFKDIINFSNGYSIDSKKMLDKEGNNTYKVFKMGNINPLGGINKDKTKSWLSKEYCNGLEKYISKKGDILMCMTDMKNSDTPLLGHTALIDKDNEFIINQRVGIIRCKKELVNYPFVYTLTNLDFFVKNIRSRANSGVQVNLSTKGICDTSLILPDRKTLDKFNDIAEPMYEEIFRNNEENETLSKLRDILLPKLMNGEIDLDNIEI